MDVPAKGNILGGCVPARYTLAALGSIGMAIVYGLKVNLSVAMTAMINQTAVRALDNGTKLAPAENSCGLDVGNATEAPVDDGPFVWDHGAQGIVLSCYFWGYLVSQIPAARVAEMMSAKWVMFFSVAINVVCTLLTPAMARLHYGAVVAMRVGEGIGGGVTFPAMHVLLARWAPPAERGVMAALVYAGTSLGTVVSMLLAGVLTGYAGWESVFYVMGGLSCLWCALWAALVADSPRAQTLITQAERDYIVHSLGGDSGHTKKLPVPWRAALTSRAFLAILVAHACSNWGWYMMLIELPFFMKQVLRFKVTELATATALPFLTLWLFSMGLSKALDSLRAAGRITTTTARKIGTLIASVIPALCLFGLTFLSCNRAAVVALTAVGVTAVGGMFCGFLSNHIDIAPNFAGTLMALTNTVATVPGIVVPMFVSALTKNDESIRSWRIIFFVTIALYAVEIVVYTLFGSGEEQSWNRVEDTESVEATPLNNDKEEKKENKV